MDIDASLHPVPTPGHSDNITSWVYLRSAHAMPYFCSEFTENILIFTPTKVAPQKQAVLNGEKKKLFQNQVISKEPADSTCLHPGVPNCSTMSP